jgi:hypothetical protein
MSEPVHEHRPVTAVTKSSENDTTVLTALPSIQVDGRWGTHSFHGRPPSDLKFIEAISEAIGSAHPVVLRSSDMRIEIRVEPDMSIEELANAWTERLNKEKAGEAGLVKHL